MYITLLTLVLLLLKIVQRKNCQTCANLHNTHTDQCECEPVYAMIIEWEREEARFNASDCEILVAFNTQAHWKKENRDEPNGLSRMRRAVLWVLLKIMPIFNVKANAEHNCGMLYWNRRNWIVHLLCMHLFFGSDRCYLHLHWPCVHLHMFRSCNIFKTIFVVIVAILPIFAITHMHIKWSNCYTIGSKASVFLRLLQCSVFPTWFFFHLTMLESLQHKWLQAI